MPVHPINIDATKVEVQAVDIQKLLGNEFGAVDAYTLEVIDKIISDCSSCLSARGSFIQVKALECAEADQIAVDGLVFETGRAIKKMLAGSEYYLFMMVTAGSGPETLARELLERGDFLEGYIADLVASAQVESAANQVQEHIRKLADRRGLKISNRYSPGYCNWDVSEQKKLFSLFPEHCCDISLSDSSLMSPIKSVTAILGMGPSVNYQEYTCELCSMTECFYRRTRI